MSLDRIVQLKRATLQTRIDALNGREIALKQKLKSLAMQGHGALDQQGGFQRAAMAQRTAIAATMKLEAECEQITLDRAKLLRERLSLDIAAEKLADAAKAERKLEESRADLRS